MNDAIHLRAATPEDEPFLIELRKLTMTGHLERAGEPCCTAIPRCAYMNGSVFRWPAKPQSN